MAAPHTVMHSEQMPVHLTFFMFPVVSKWGKAAYINLALTLAK